MAQYTLKDISSATGYSLPTVSRVLSGSDYPVREEVRRAIEEYAREVGYVPNMLARGLKTRFYPEIAVVLPSLSNPFYTSVLTGIDEELTDTEFSMMVYMFGHNESKAANLIHSLCSKRVAGVIIAADTLATNKSIDLAEFRNRDIPVIVFDEVSENPSSLDGVFFDYFKGGWMAAEHLYDMGHRKVAFITRVLDRPTRHKLAEGIKGFFSHKGIPLSDTDIYQSNIQDNFTAGLMLAREVMSSGEGYTAIIANSDAVATGAMSAFIQQDVKVPEQMSVIGVDNSIFSRITTPLLTTIEVPSQSMGSHAARILLDLVEKNGESSRVHLQPALVRRSTVRDMNSTAEN